jgi:hypothetical protein
MLIYAHKDIFEGRKYHRDFTTFLDLGKSLSIREDTFEDLNEVYPMQNYNGLA